MLGWQATTLFSAEAKMSAGGFISQNHQKDALKSKAIGADMHIAVCLEDIPESIGVDIKQACKAEGISVRILDRSQLLV
ncbi:hypothetical protein GCM10022252_12150 [Streptosporangium oxazolinicum]|uniref:Uncharacterized protein n=1 Tax=Streptosporangium oxazolinicum TaxID=909287 RepID=A0ABP8AHC1_9ACTN